MSFNITAKKQNDTYYLSGMGYKFSLVLSTDTKGNRHLSGSTLLFKDEEYKHQFIIQITDPHHLPNEEEVATKVKGQIHHMTDYILKDKHLKSLVKDRDKQALAIYPDITY